MRIGLALTLSCFVLYLLIGCDLTSVVPEDNTNDDTAQTVRILPESIALNLDMQSKRQTAPTTSAPSSPPPTSAPSGPAPSGPAPSPSLAGGATPLEIAESEAQRTMSQLDEIMLRYQIINSMVTSAADVQVSGTIVWDTTMPGSVPTSVGSQVPNPGPGAGDTREIKVDFSAFDYDGDGVDDGTGTPTTAPVALRVWVTDSAGTYQPAACGVITVLPTTADPGEGHMTTLSYARNSDGDITLLDWDQDDPSYNTLATWDEHPNGAGTWGYSSFWVEIQDVSGTQQTTVCSTIDSEYVAATWYAGAPAAGVISHVGTWADYLAHPPAVLYSEFVTYAPATASDAMSVDVSSLGFVEQPNPTDMTWPSTFPNTPTF